MSVRQSTVVARGNVESAPGAPQDAGSRYGVGVGRRAAYAGTNMPRGPIAVQEAIVCSRHEFGARIVDGEFISEVQSKVREAADALRTSDLPPAPVRRKCAVCDCRGMCTAGRAPG